MNFLRKTICSTNFPTFMNLFGHWATNVQNVALFFSAGPSKKQPMSPEVLCDEKQNVSSVSKKGVFVIIVYGLRSEKFALSKKNNCLGSKTLFYVSRGTSSEKIFVSKSYFFVKCYRALRENFSDFWGSCFRHGCHHSVLLLRRKVSGKTFSKKFFPLFPDLEQKIDYWRNIRMNVNTLF